MARFHRQTADRTRLRVIFAAVCLLLIAGVWTRAWIADRHQRSIQIDDLAARVRTSANAYALAIGARLRTVDQMLVYAAADYARDPDRFDLAFWLQQIPAIRAYSPEFSFADAGGVLRQSSVGSAALGISIADREHFLVHRDGARRRLFVSQPVLGRSTNRRSIQLSRRVEGPNGAFAGVLVFSVEPEFFLEVLDQMKVGVLGGGAVRRDGGAPIARVSRFGRDVEGGSPIAALAVSESADAAYLGDIYGADIVRASRKIPDYDLIVDAEGDVTEALAEIAATRALNRMVAGTVTIALIGMFGLMFIDLRRLRRLRAELERRNAELTEAHRTAQAAVEAKSRFLANMSHELRTPLNAILGFAELLKSGLYGPLSRRQSEYAQHIHQSGHHLLTLINDVLDISRLDLDAYVLEPGPLDLAESIGASVRTMAVVADQKGVRVTASLPPALPRVHADERALRQILLNLLSNAIKFTPAGGSVEIAARLREDGTLAIVVADTGIGIAAQDLARLFHPFQRAETARRSNAEGTGLGLVISRRLIEKHGGSLDLESEVGKGTRAILVLPADRVLPAAETAADRRLDSALAA